MNVKEATAAEGGKCKKEGGFAPAAVDCAVAASNDCLKTRNDVDQEIVIFCVGNPAILHPADNLGGQG